MILRGKVDSRNEEAIRKALMKIIHDFTPIKGELNLEMEKEVYKTQEGYTSYLNHLLVLFLHMIYEVIVLSCNYSFMFVLYFLPGKS